MCLGFLRLLELSSRFPTCTWPTMGSMNSENTVRQVHVPVITPVMGHGSSAHTCLSI